MLKLILLALMPVIANASPDLAAYKWKSRVIVLRSSDQGSILAAREKLEKHASALLERSVVIVEDKTGKTLEIELYGKDGGKKWQGDQNFKVKTIIDLIDSMPMRKDEARTN
jgi:hypothetical protein